MKKLSKKMLIVIISLSLLFVAGISVFAYFMATSEKDVKGTTAITNETIIEIASFDDLFNYSKASTYNDKDIVSNASNRKILKLTEDVVSLNNDLVITSDVHINLNGKTLDLNDYSLTFKHGYTGVFSLFNGNVLLGDNGNGKITIDLPNASFVTNGVTYKNGNTTIEKEECVNILHIDSKYTAYSALYYASDRIATDLGERVKFEDYDTVKAETFTLTDEKFISSKLCSFNSNNSECCSFVYKDLDLIDHYLSTDVTIEYSSSSPNIISNDGKVTLPSTSSDVNLTICVNHSSWSNPISCTFKLHVVNLSNSTIKDQVSKDLMKAYLFDYYHDTGLKIDETISLKDYYYGFSHGVNLPLTALDGNITYSYSLKDLSGNEVNTTSHIEGNTYVLEPNGNCYKLVINYNNSSLEELNMYSEYAGDRETIARLILNELYGGSIVFDSSSQLTKLYNFSDLSTELDERTFGYVESYNITNLTYSLKTDTDALTYYNYSNYELTVAEGKIPPAKVSYITATFTFGSGKEAQTIDVDLYINYLAQSGNTVAGFLPYYNLYDPQVASYMTASFEMPFCFGTGAPYICYDFSKVFTKVNTTVEEESITYYNYTLGMSSGLQIVLYYDGAEKFTFTNYTSQESFTVQLDTYLQNNNLTLSQLGNKGAKYIFKINAQNATVDSVKMLLLYNYKFNTENKWDLYKYQVDKNNGYVTELTSTEFTVDGGLFYNATSSKVNAVQDPNFFAWIYNNFNPDTTAQNITASAVNSNSFIPKSWLSLDVALDKTVDNTLASVSNYAGIGNLTNITKVNLSGINLSPSVLKSISSMTSVTDLNLSNCGITDISSICKMNSIKKLDVSRNSIKNFNDLVKLKNLEEVYVYSNNVTIDNPIVGSLGITNLQTYNDLLKNGVAVFNQVSGDVPVIYADSDDYNDYVKIKSIIYQNKLSTTKSIETIYAKFKENYNANNLSLKNTGGTFTWGYQTSDDEGNTYTVNTATYFYANYTFNGNTVNVKFYVDRY